MKSRLLELHIQWQGLRCDMFSFQLQPEDAGEPLGQALEEDTRTKLGTSEKAAAQRHVGCHRQGHCKLGKARYGAGDGQPNKYLLQ